MKKIVSAATAGFMEKNDVLVTVEPSQKGIEVELTSDVERQYGEHMRDLIRETVEEAGYDNVKVTATDKGAWDYTISLVFWAPCKGVDKHNDRSKNQIVQIDDVRTLQ